MATVFNGWLKTSIPYNMAIKGIAYGNGMFVAVSSGGGMIYSRDGVTWTLASVSGYYNCVAFGAGKFIAIETSSVATSTDGINWSVKSTNLEIESWQSVTYGGGLFVAVASTGECATSADGLTWTNGQTGSNNNQNAIVYTGTRYVAAGFRTICHSTNGLNWTFVSVPVTDTWISAAYGDGSIVVCGQTSVVRSTDDGLTWTSVTMPNSKYGSITYGNGIFIAVTKDNKYSAYSTDGGKTWSAVELPAIASWFVIIGGTVAAAVADGTTTAVYSIMNTPPTAPTSITVPTSINGGTQISISWSEGSDVDNNLAGYILERSVSGGAFAQVYKGALRSYTDSITFGWSSVAYRVKSYDAYGSESDYTTSDTRTVNNNTAPVITGNDGNLGSFSDSFTAQSYVVTDAEGGDVTVVERIDGVTIRQFISTLGSENSFGFTDSEWREVLNGAHTITITATDSKGASSARRWTFTKSVNTFSFTTSPLPADAMPDRCIVGAAGGFPDGSTLKIDVCNNANDASPTWEDISTKAMNGQKHFFQNKEKTAIAWAFGLRCTLTRGSATGSVWLDYITINYR